MTISSSKDGGVEVLIGVCETSAVQDGEVLRVEIDGLPPLAVYNAEGEFFVSDDTCSHGDASLAEGFLDGTEIECPWHSGKFCVRTGRALTFPAVKPIRVYPVTIQGATVFIPTPADTNTGRTCRGDCESQTAEVVNADKASSTV